MNDFKDELRKDKQQVTTKDVNWFPPKHENVKINFDGGIAMNENAT